MQKGEGGAITPFAPQNPPLLMQPKDSTNLSLTYEDSPSHDMHKLCVLYICLRESEVERLARGDVEEAPTSV